MKFIPITCNQSTFSGFDCKCTINKLIKFNNGRRNKEKSGKYFCTNKHKWRSDEHGSKDLTGPEYGKILVIKFRFGMR